RSYGTESREEWRHMASQPCAARSYGTRLRSAAWGCGGAGPRRWAAALGTPGFATIRIAASAAPLAAAAQPLGAGLGEQTLSRASDSIAGVDVSAGEQGAGHSVPRRPFLLPDGSGAYSARGLRWSGPARPLRW